jgi:hypothetical protein
MLTDFKTDSTRLAITMFELFNPRAWPLIALFVIRSSSIQIWSAPGAMPTTIPASCRASLSSDIACAPRLIRAREVADAVPLDDTFLNQYCNSTCTTSITASNPRIQELLQVMLLSGGGRPGRTLFMLVVETRLTTSVVTSRCQEIL